MRKFRLLIRWPPYESDRRFPLASSGDAEVRNLHVLLERVAVQGAARHKSSSREVVVVRWVQAVTCQARDSLSSPFRAESGELSSSYAGLAAAALPGVLGFGAMGKGKEKSAAELPRCKTAESSFLALDLLVMMGSLTSHAGWMTAEAVCYFKVAAE
ncbi:hypothetical protein GQ44DRAFT_777374 [Phaeosphaeriaceae sp. PMI808]|nr:hypothetical protein GQ44DRAFT_777374 [Phaeosphaeriaceae sp. PMI808]